MDNSVKWTMTNASVNALCTEQRFAVDKVFAQDSLLRKILHRVSPVRDQEGQTTKTFMARPQKVIVKTDRCNLLEASEIVPVTIPRRDRGRHTYPRNRNNNSSV